jgi:riboflavin synthase
MFTGLIQATGTVISLLESVAATRLEVECAGWPHHPKPGESIAVDGCCLTVVEAKGSKESPSRSVAGGSDGRRMSFDIVPQTLRMTSLGLLKAGDRVNLEHAATPQTLLGGHIVQGHVDGVGVVRQVNQRSNEYRLTIGLPIDLMEFVVPQGSIAIAGVSLTIASVSDESLDVALIPTTLALTNLGDRHAGDSVNVEVDCIMKTVVHWLRRQGR